MTGHNDLMYRLLVQSVVDYALYLLTPDGIVANWNAGAERAKGYTQAEIVGKHFSCFYSPEDRAAGIPDRGLETARATGRFEAEGWRYRKDGTAFWAHVIIDAVRDDDGKLVGFAKITRDITEQRRRQLEQSEQERYFRLLVQGVTDYAIYMLDPDGRVISWNAGAERTKGYTEGEIIGFHFSCFYSEQDRLDGLPARGLETARETGRSETEGWRYRKDGTAFWAHVIIDAVHDEDNKLIGYAKITRDVTERREREQQVVVAKELAERYSEEMASLSNFLDTVVTHIPSAVLVQDAVSRQVMLANTQAEKFFGSSEEHMVGKHPRDCLPEEVSAYIDNLVDAAVRSQTPIRTEDAVRTGYGTRTLRSNSMVIRGQDPRSSYVMTIADDVTEELNASAQIHYMAHHDSLTGLPNRLLFRQRLNEVLRGDASQRLITAVLCLDLDHFKNVNDGLGHQYGDELLRQLAARLRKTLREQDTLARLGGDEFAIVLPSIKRPDDAYHTALRIIDVVRPPFQIEGHTVTAGVSVGIALAPLNHSATDQLLRYADMALYEAKRNGRNRLECFRPELDETARKRRLIEIDLREALVDAQLKLYYQPITDRERGSITGYEALMRWHHPRQGVVMPLEFIPIAEETGLIHEIGAFALREACHEAATWDGVQSVAVNLSPVQFRNSGFVSVVESALTTSGLDPQRLELEITESVLLENTDANIETLKRLKAMGVRIALDDFGTGYSSLSYLRSFPFDKIKIDKSFTRDMHESREAMAIIRAIIGMSRSLEIQATAEGVETEGQLAYLMAEGCNQFQGYLFGMPQPVRALRSL
ncbi:sensor domain-containing protein [Dyella sp.]|uniref:sensor domain-containing protein n=1 Tax=Dyella sp. TaxID=1869338 RepID=UPI002ED18BC1